MPRSRILPSTTQRAIVLWSGPGGTLIAGEPAETLTAEMPTWPPELPEWPLIEGYQETGVDIVIRSSLTQASPRVRRRTASGVRPHVLLFHMTKAQVEILDAFYNVDCVGGTMPFQYVDLHILTPLAWRFTDAPKYVPRGDQENWTVTLPLEAYQRVP